MEDHADLLGLAVAANALVGVEVVTFQVIGRHIPAWLVEHFDGMQAGLTVITLGQALQHIQRVLAILRLGVPFADILDPAVIEAVLAAGGGVQVQDDPQLAFVRPGERPVEYLDSPLDERVGVVAVAAVVGVIRAEDPVAEWNAHGIDAPLVQPDEVIARDEAVPVLPEPLRGTRAHLGAPGGLIRGLQPIEQAGGHPFFQNQPAAQVHSAQFLARVGVNGDLLRHGCTPWVSENCTKYEDRLIRGSGKYRPCFGQSLIALLLSRASGILPDCLCKPRSLAGARQGGPWQHCGGACQGKIIGARGGPQRGRLTHQGCADAGPSVWRGILVVGCAMRTVAKLPVRAAHPTEGDWLQG
ncbi:hypothetical protein FQZ97_575400 [compost metagenome]